MNNNLNDGGPAFPRKTDLERATDGTWETVLGNKGMSLRDYFAAAALTGLAAAAAHPNGPSFEKVVPHALELADGMIAARDAGTEISMADQELSDHLKNIKINQELLSVLEEALEWDGHDDQDVKSVWFDKAEAAIAKAKNQLF